MNWDSLELRIKKECQEKRKSQRFTRKYIAYAKNLFSKNVPIISSPRHFSLLVGLDHQYVCNMANGTKSFYRSFTIKKKNGKKRYINEPLPDLKFVQHWILNNILEKCPVSAYAKAFYKKRTLKSNARFHRAQAIVLTMDIKDFFPSIKVFDVYEVFKDIGYLDNVSWFLANLCCLNGALPQGAPTSPYLSNLRMVKFDNDVEKYIKENGLRYTRYADDLTFSGDFNPHFVIHEISQLLFKYGFKINSDKTRVARKNARQEVTGIVVNHHMQISKEKRRDIRQQVYFIRKFGLESHLEYIGESRKHYLDHLLGQINFALFVNNKDLEMQEYFEFIKNLIQKTRDVSAI